MIKRLLILFIALIVGACALGISGDILPWRTFQDLQADVVGGTMGACGEGQPVAKIEVARDGRTFLLFLTPEYRFVIAELGKDGIPVTLHIGQAKSADAVIHVKVSRPFEPKDAQTGPCPLIYPKDA